MKYLKHRGLPEHSHSLDILSFKKVIKPKTVIQNYLKKMFSNLFLLWFFPTKGNLLCVT